MCASCLLTADVSPIELWLVRLDRLLREPGLEEFLLGEDGDLEDVFDDFLRLFVSFEN